MRKLLLLCYALWKNDRAYDAAYHPAQAGPLPECPVSEPHEMGRSVSSGPRPLGKRGRAKWTGSKASIPH